MRTHPSQKLNAAPYASTMLSETLEQKYMGSNVCYAFMEESNKNCLIEIVVMWGTDQKPGVSNLKHTPFS